MVQIEDVQEQPVGPDPPGVSDSGLSDLFDTKLTIASATVDDDLAQLAEMVRDAAGLDAGMKGAGPTTHTIELVFTAHKTSSLDVYDAFGEWLEDLSKFVKANVDAARPPRAVSPPSTPRHTYTRDKVQKGAPGGKQTWPSTPLGLRAAVVPPARRPDPQVPPANPTNAPRLSLWDNFLGPPPSQSGHRSPAMPPTHDYIEELCHNYDDSD